MPKTCCLHVMNGRRPSFSRSSIRCAPLLFVLLRFSSLPLAFLYLLLCIFVHTQRYTHTQRQSVRIVSIHAKYAVCNLCRALIYRWGKRTSTMPRHRAENDNRFCEQERDFTTYLPKYLCNVVCSARRRVSPGFWVPCANMPSVKYTCRYRRRETIATASPIQCACVRVWKRKRNYFLLLLSLLRLDFRVILIWDFSSFSTSVRACVRCEPRPLCMSLCHFCARRLLILLCICATRPLNVRKCRLLCRLCVDVSIVEKSREANIVRRFWVLGCDPISHAGKSPFALSIWYLISL